MICVGTNRSFNRFDLEASVADKHGGFLLALPIRIEVRLQRFRLCNPLRSSWRLFALDYQIQFALFIERHVANFGVCQLGNLIKLRARFPSNSAAQFEQSAANAPAVWKRRVCFAGNAA